MACAICTENAEFLRRVAKRSAQRGLAHADVTASECADALILACRHEPSEASEVEDTDSEIVDWLEQQFIAGTTTVIRSGRKTMAVLHRLEPCTIRSLAAQGIFKRDAARGR